MLSKNFIILTNCLCLDISNVGDALDWSYDKVWPRNKVNLKNISYLMNSPLFFRWKIGFKKSFITQMIN